MSNYNENMLYMIETLIKEEYHTKDGAYFISKYNVPRKG
jgi:hypothetical protein